MATELDGAEELGEGGLGVGVHTDDDDEGDEAVVGHDLGLLHGPGRPLLRALAVPAVGAPGALSGLPLPLQRNPRRH